MKLYSLQLFMGFLALWSKMIDISKGVRGWDTAIFFGVFGILSLVNYILEVKDGE